MLDKEYYLREIRDKIKSIHFFLYVLGSFFTLLLTYDKGWELVLATQIMLFVGFMVSYL